MANFRVENISKTRLNASFPMKRIVDSDNVVFKREDIYKLTILIGVDEYRV
jgi:hypothetical protein